MNDRQLKDVLAKMDEIGKSAGSNTSWIEVLVFFILVTLSVTWVQTQRAAHDCYNHGYTHYEHGLCSKTVDGTDITIRVGDLPDLEEEE